MEEEEEEEEREEGEEILDEATIVQMRDNIR